METSTKICSIVHMLRNETRGCAVGSGIVLDWSSITRLMKTVLNRVILYSIKGYCLVLMMLMMMEMMNWEHHRKHRGSRYWEPC